MRKSKIICSVLCLVLLCCMCTGCIDLETSCKFAKDGSCEISAQFGYAKEIYDSMKAENPDDYNGFSPKLINGQEYYVMTESAKLDSYKELFDRNFVEDIVEGLNIADVDTDFLKSVTVDEKGNYSAVITFKNVTGTDENMALALNMLSSMVLKYSLTFPKEMVQVSGNTEGIVIKGNCIEINYVEVLKSVLATGKPTTIMFTTKGKSLGFSDLATKNWAYPAVASLFDGGLVKGVSATSFNPNGNITMGQLCSMICRAKGLDEGTLNGYWAGNAVQNCLEAGYIESCGEVNKANYDFAITREQAVSAMYRAYVDKNARAEVLLEDAEAVNVPDMASVSANLKADIENAYKLNITNGVDATLAFHPAEKLTRAQVCQLFFNIGWIEGK